MTTQSDIDVLIVSQGKSMKNTLIGNLSTLASKIGIFIDVTYVDTRIYKHYQSLPVVKEAIEGGFKIWEKKKI